MNNARAPRIRPSIIRGIAVVLLSTLIASAYIPGARYLLAAGHMGRMEVGDFGCDYDEDSGPITQLDPGGAAALAGLKLGDRIDLDAMAPEYQRDVDWRETSLPGKRSEWHILRGRKSFVAQLVSQPHFVDPDHVLWKNIQRFIALLSLIVGSLLLLRRPGKMTLGFYLFCVSLTAWIIPFLFMHGGWLIATHILTIALEMIGAVGFLIFALRFPHDVATGWRRRIDASAPLLYTGAAVLSLVCSISHRALSEPINPIWEVTLYAVFALAVAVLVSSLLSSSEEKQPIRWAIAGCILGSVGIPLRFLLDTHVNAPDWLWHGAHLLPILTPIAAAYGVLSSAREEPVPTPARRTT